jgi:hypothetical protein
MVRFCLKCGLKLDGGFKYCPECGAVIDSAPDKTDEPVGVLDADPSVVDQGLSAANARINVALQDSSVIVVMVLSCLSIYLLLSNPALALGLLPILIIAGILSVGYLQRRAYKRALHHDDMLLLKDERYNRYTRGSDTGRGAY